MVGGVLINWSAILDAIDLVLEILDFAPSLVTALQVAWAVAHGVWQQLHVSCAVERVLKLRLKVRQVGCGQVFDAHADSPSNFLTASVGQNNLPDIFKGRNPPGADS
jgi:transcriptional regulatory protein LevR